MNVILLFCMAVYLGSCRKDYPSPYYPPPKEKTVEVPTEGFPLGPDPFVEGDKRLFLGIFYEGDYSNSLEQLEVGSNLVIFEQTFSLEQRDEDAVEGQFSHRLTYEKDLGWWGGALIVEPSIDLSQWQSLHISFRSPSVMYRASQLALKDGSDNEAKVSIIDYGFDSDDQWHHLVIPLDDFTSQGVRLGDIIFPFMIVGEAGDQGVVGDNLYIDNVYFK